MGSGGAFEGSASLFLVSVRRRAPSTLRNYQIAVGQFCEFICSPLYG